MPCRSAGLCKSKLDHLEAFRVKVAFGEMPHSAHARGTRCGWPTPQPTSCDRELGMPELTLLLLSLSRLLVITCAHAWLPPPLVVVLLLVVVVFVFRSPFFYFAQLFFSLFCAQSLHYLKAPREFSPSLPPYCSPSLLLSFSHSLALNPSLFHAKKSRNNRVSLQLPALSLSPSRFGS